MANDSFHISRFYQEDAELYCGVDVSALEVMEDPADKVWVTSDKRRVPVSGMDNWHLYNAIRFLARKGKRSIMLETEVMKRFEIYKRDNAGKLRSLLKSGSWVEDITGHKPKLRNIIRE
jgi:hypothetical protein